MDLDGSILWMKRYSKSTAKEIIQTNDSGFAFIGVSDVTGYNKYWVVKTDRDGILEWQKIYGGGLEDWGASISKTKDDGFVLAGTVTSDDGDITGEHDFHNARDAWVLKIDSKGTIKWQRALGGTGFEEAFSLKALPDGNIIVTGYATSNDGDLTSNKGGGDVWVVKFGKESSAEVKPEVYSSLFLSIFPNPTTSISTIHFNLLKKLKVTLSIFDALGNEIPLYKCRDMGEGKHSIEWNTTGYPNGVYTCRLGADGISVASKFIISR